MKERIRNQTTGTRRAGRRFSVLQSFRFNSESPLPVMSNPPTISNSAISASLMAVLLIWATSQNMLCQQNSTGAAKTIPMPYVEANTIDDTKSSVALVKRKVWSPFKAEMTGPSIDSGPMQ